MGPVFEQPADSRGGSTLFARLVVFLVFTAWMMCAGAGAPQYMASHPITAGASAD